MSPLPRRIAAPMIILGALSACGVSGPPNPGVVPALIDMHADLGKIEGSTALGGPLGWTPAPTIRTPVFRATATQLFAAMQDFMLAQPRTWQTGARPDQLQATFLVRSVVMNFPDAVVLQAVPASDTTSKAVILSRSRYDAFVFINENQDRVRSLIKALTDRFGTVPPG